MNAHALGSATTGFAALARDALRGLRWPQLRLAMIFGLAVTVWTALVFVHPLIQFARTMSLERLILQGAVMDQIKALCLLFAVLMADSAVDHGAPRRRAYVVAVLVGCSVGILLTEPLNWAWRTYLPAGEPPAHRRWLHGSAALVYHPVFALTHWLVICAAAVFLYADRRAARQTEQLLHAAELDRIRRSKRALESRLQAMQARVEPQFLLNTLAQVERLYELDAALAARMLDDLIAYLRAAMPLMRDTASTVAQEIALTRAYLDIVRIRLGDRLAFEVTAPPDAGRIRMPPMMLLPLTDHAIVHGLEPSTDGGTISIRVEERGDRLRLTIADNGAGFVPETAGDGIASIRERLSALYGANAGLTLRQVEPRTTEAVLEIPLERRDEVAGPPP